MRHMSKKPFSVQPIKASEMLTGTITVVHRLIFILDYSGVFFCKQGNRKRL